jgi:hypothetical protein
MLKKNWTLGSSTSTASSTGVTVVFSGSVTFAPLCVVVPVLVRPIV